MGKILVIEGTDCSGKETQAKMLMEKLKNENYKVAEMSFPVYEKPTGKIIGGPYLGKPHICETWFPEGPVNVPWKVASLYYAADRLYHLKELLKLKEENDFLILDRYVFSNMAHQGGKIQDNSERQKAYNFLEELEFNLLGLPRPDKVIFLHMPFEYAAIIKKERLEALDGHEKDEHHLRQAEKVYLELAKLYNFITIECINNGKIKTREEMSEEINTHIKKLLK